MIFLKSKASPFPRQRVRRAIISDRTIDVIVSANDQRFDQQMFVLTATRFAGLPQSTVKFFVVQTGDEQGDFCVLITFIESCPHQKGT